MLRLLTLTGLVALASLARAQEPVKLEMPKADVREILRFYGNLAKKQVVLDNTIQGQLSVVTEEPVSREQAMRLIEQALLLNGFSLVDRGPNAVAVLGISKNPRQGGVPVITRAEDLPAQEKVITFVFRLKHREPSEVQQLLQQYIPAQTFTSFVADPRAKLLIVTESTTVVRSIQDLMKEIDVPVPPMKAAPPPKAESAPPRPVPPRR